VHYIAELGLQAVEFGTGGWSAAPHLKLEELLGGQAARDRLRSLVRDHGLSISALNCSGNPLHPGEAGGRDRETTLRTLELASLLGVERVVLMSGLPAAPGDQYPNWITSSWPPEAEEILEWQWKERLIPYWRQLEPVAAAKGLKLCLEQHGRQCVYNTETFFRLREAIGPAIGVNFDPSHLLWMGGDPLQAIQALGACIFHVHGKDTRIEPAAAVNGLLDAKPAALVGRRSWNFASVGRGRSRESWQRIVAALKQAGYDEVISIENEDHQLPADEAIRASAEVLRSAIAGLS
jgi:sugar phosphate isomerase/epimerase